MARSCSHSEFFHNVCVPVRCIYCLQCQRSWKCTYKQGLHALFSCNSTQNASSTKSAQTVENIWFFFCCCYDFPQVDAIILKLLRHKSNCPFAPICPCIFGCYGWVAAGCCNHCRCCRSAQTTMKGLCGSMNPTSTLRKCHVCHE